MVRGVWGVCAVVEVGGPSRAVAYVGWGGWVGCGKGGSEAPRPPTVTDRVRSRSGVAAMSMSLRSYFSTSTCSTPSHTSAALSSATATAPACCVRSSPPSASAAAREKSSISSATAR